MTARSPGSNIVREDAAYLPVGWLETIRTIDGMGPIPRWWLGCLVSGHVRFNRPYKWCPTLSWDEVEASFDPSAARRAHHFNGIAVERSAPCGARPAPHPIAEVLARLAPSVTVNFNAGAPAWATFPALNICRDEWNRLSGAPVRWPDRLPP